MDYRSDKLQNNYTESRALTSISVRTKGCTCSFRAQSCTVFSNWGSIASQLNSIKQKYQASLIFLPEEITIYKGRGENLPSPPSFSSLSSTVITNEAHRKGSGIAVSEYLIQGQIYNVQHSYTLGSSVANMTLNISWQ